MTAQFNTKIAGAPLKSGSSAWWFEAIGREDDNVATYGQTIDLMVVSKPNKEVDLSVNEVLNAAIFETGRPVLVVPINVTEVHAKNIEISWNGSPQSARAVSSALPFLKSAQTVTAVTLESGHSPSRRGSNLTSYLPWHGIPVKMESLSGPSSTAGSKLMEHIKSTDSDLLVMGAYTHSRMRQLILGGVTQYIL